MFWGIVTVILLDVLAGLLAVVCAVGEGALVARRPRLAFLPPLGAALAVALGGYGMGSEGGLFWLVLLLCAAFACLGSIAGLAAGIVRRLAKKKEG